MCQLPPPEMPQVSPHPHPHSSTGNFSLAFLPCITGCILVGRGLLACLRCWNSRSAADRNHPLGPSHFTQPAHLFPGDQGSKVMREHPRSENSQHHSSFPKGVQGQGCTWTNIWAGRGRRGLVMGRGTHRPLGKATREKVM